MSELNSRYNTLLNGKLQQIVSFDDAVISIKEHIKRVELKNQYLEKENKIIKDEKYKDIEMSKMKKELEKAKSDISRSFLISEEEWESIKEWQDKHNKQKHGSKLIEGRPQKIKTMGTIYSFCFTPTPIGTLGECRCNCGETFYFQDP